MLFLKLEFMLYTISACPYSVQSSDLPDVPLFQAICDTWPALLAGHKTPQTFSFEQSNFKYSSEFKGVVDVVVDVTVVIVVVVVVIFGLRAKNHFGESLFRWWINLSIQNPAKHIGWSVFTKIYQNLTFFAVMLLESN